MKKFLNVLMLVLFVGLLFSCQDSTEPENTDYTNFSEGWWKYTSKTVYGDNECEETTICYFYYESDMSISSSYKSYNNGSSGFECQLSENEKEYQYKWASLFLRNGYEVFKNIPSIANDKEYEGYTLYYFFEKIAEEDLPSWISTSQNTFSSGWYLYTTNANSAKPQKTYFYINSDGTIARAGSESNEYSGTQLESLHSQFSYSVCVKNADGTVITFAEAQAPSWADKSSSSNNSTGESSDDDNSNSNNESSSGTNLSPIVGKWYCSNASLIKYLEFNADGTGKAYASDPSNYSSFTWSVSGSEITLEGNLENTNSKYSSKNFTVNSDTLWFQKLIGLENLTYIRQ